ncbi:MAG: M55 family metallopeptidase [Lentisphaeria bacterium]|nr:M55 family metallopeptidase [Lentisphaeria bacterium]
MTVFVFVDMEGISGISGSDFVKTDGRLYATGRRYYTEDLNACIRGCFRGGATAVIARDGHGGGNHVLWEDLDGRATLVQGPTGTVRLAGIEECQALILLGYHAMAGTRGALLEHTYSSASIQNMWLNGRPVGEVGIDAAIAGDYGVPTVLVTGDNYVCREAREWIPGVMTCEVKQGLGCQAARLLPRETARRMIEDTTAEAVRRHAGIEPLRVARPVTIRREMIERGAVPSRAESAAFHIVDGRTYETTAETVERAFFG